MQHHAEHRVTAGDRVVGEEQHRNARGRQLDGAGDGALARQFAAVRPLEGRPVQAQADAVGLRGDDPVGAVEIGEDVGTEPVGARAGNVAQHGNLRGRGRRGFGRPDHARRRSRQHRQFGAGNERRRTDAGHGVGRAAAEHERQVETAAYGEITAHAPQRGAEGQPFAGVQRERGVGGYNAGCGIRSADRDENGCPSHGEHLLGAGVEHEAAEGVFEHCGGGRVANQSIGAAQGSAVEGAGAGHAEVGEAGAAEILHGGLRPGLHDDKVGGQVGWRRRGRRRGPHELVHGPKSHPVTGLQQGRLIAVEAPQGGVGAADQLPATGSDPRIHGRIAVGERHRTGRNGLARAAAPGDGEPVVTDEIGEAGGEAAERGGP